MSNFATLRAELSAELHLLVSDTDINRKICAAIRFMRDKRLWFSEKTFAFNLAADKQTYIVGKDGPPPDLVEIVGPELQLLIGGSADQRMRVIRVPSREWEARQFAGTQVDQPQVWDFWANSLRLYPIPNSSDDVLTGRYVRDIGAPEVRYNTTTSAFEFFAPGGTTVLTAAQLSAWGGDWLDPRGGYAAVKARTAYLLLKDVKDVEGANEQLGLWLELTQQLETEQSQRGGTTEILGVLLDVDDDVFVGEHW